MSTNIWACWNRIRKVLIRALSPRGEQGRGLAPENYHSASPLISSDMDRLDKIFKKPSDNSKQHISLGIPTNIAAGPLGFRAELDIGPKGEQDCLSCLRADQPEQTTTLDEKDTRASRIVFHDKCEDQGLPALGTPNTSTAVGGDGHGNEPKGERFRPLSLMLAFTLISMPLHNRRGHC